MKLFIIFLILLFIILLFLLKNSKMLILSYMSRLEKVLLLISLIFIIISISILIPFQIKYESSQKDKSNLITTDCNIINQTIDKNNYSCNKKIIGCECNTFYYYPCDILLIKNIEGYCCDSMCYKNSSLNQLNYIICGNDLLIISIIQNNNNITNIFTIKCGFDNNNCINKWTHTMKKIFECYYYITNPNTIILDKPNFIERNNIAFIFAYIFLIIGCSLIIFVSSYGTVRYYQNRNEYVAINNKY